jgi:hypothetical protein
MVTDSKLKMRLADAGDAQRLRARGRRMLELANRAYCEEHYDFARLLTLLATEAFEHASEMDRPREEKRIAAR